MAAYTAGQLSEWRATLAARQARSERQLEARRQRAGDVARKAADLLRSEFNAQRVVLFGSLVHGMWYSNSSDIDLAVSGLPADTHLRAVAVLNDIDPDFSVDVVRWESCSEALRATIVREGTDL